MVGTSVKKTTFKQRVRTNDLKQRHKFARDVIKRARLGRRVSNRFDRVATNSRPMEEMMSEIAQGMAIPSQEVIDDPRSLTDMLLLMQPSSSLPPCHAVQATRLTLHTRERAALHAETSNINGHSIAATICSGAPSHGGKDDAVASENSLRDEDGMTKSKSSLTASLPTRTRRQSPSFHTTTSLSATRTIPISLPDPREVEVAERARLLTHEASGGNITPVQHGGLTYSSASAGGGVDSSTQLPMQPKNQYRHHGQPYIFWERLGLHPLLLRALRALHFTHPTPVQEKVLPTALLDLPTAALSSAKTSLSKLPRTVSVQRSEDAGTQDMVVSAETGSGKTLVFALPILQDILQSLDRDNCCDGCSIRCDGDIANDDNSKSADIIRNGNHAIKANLEQERAHTGRRKRSRRDATCTSLHANPSTRDTKKDDDGEGESGKDTLAQSSDAATALSNESVTAATAVSSSLATDIATRVMFALILSPTRELALQIDTMMRQLTQFCTPAVSIGCIVGGMAAEKQQRVLNRHPHILIATPGRLWELVQSNEGCYLGHSISRRLHYVVLDEADKMLESGRFAELHHLLERIHSEMLPSGFNFGRTQAPALNASACNSASASTAPATDVLEAGYWDEKRQKFVPMSQAKGMHESQQERSAATTLQGPSSQGNRATTTTATTTKDRSSSSPSAHTKESSNTTKAFCRKRSTRGTKRQCDDDDDGSEEEAEEAAAEHMDARDEENAHDGSMQQVRAGVTMGWRNKDQPRPMIATPAAPPEGHCVRTYVTSATLSLQTKYERRDYKSKKSIIRTSNADVMNKVLQQLQIKVSKARTFSVMPEHGVAAKINETYLRCAEESKDLYLYYFLKTYRDERTIVFVNAISMLRRMVKLLEVLGIAVVGLHASMQQRQRLKYIDKFKHGAAKVLIATDIASRGLDIDGLKYVVHLQVPRSTDVYIHRCGRTARCGGTGLSLLLVNAAEHVSFHKLMESIGRKESDIELFALQATVVHQLHQHVRMALQIDKLQREIDKSRARNQWAARASKEAELEVDDMYDDEADQVNQEKLKAIKQLKRELDLMTRKFTGSYGGKGAFRTGAHALGAKAAEERLHQRAKRQTLRLRK